MDAMQILDLPSEILLNIVKLLECVDICAIRHVNSHLKHLCDNESVWISKAKSDFRVRLKAGESSVSPRVYYQNMLYKFGPMFGLWQRQNLKFYSGLLKVSYADRIVTFENLVPTSDIFSPLKCLKFLTVALSDDGSLLVHSHDKMTSTKKVRINLNVQNSESTLEIINSNMKDYITSPAEWRELLEEFKSWDTSQDSELALMKFVSLYHSRTMFSYKRLYLPRCHLNPIRRCPLRPGLFKGSYGGHGVELVKLVQVVKGSMMGTYGVKVTGDPNVPFNEVTFQILAEDCLSIPFDMQKTVNGIRSSMMDNITVPYQENVHQSFCVPFNMIERVPIKKTQCVGRWAAEAQIASHMFQDPQMIEANFVLFNEDEFAVMFLDLNTISMFHRLKNI